MGHHSLDHLDKKILQMVAEDARIPFLEVARECNVSGAAIHQRIQKLINLGVIKGSQFIIDPEKIGYETCAFIGLNLKDPSDFRTVVEGLKKIPEVVECHFTSGEFDSKRRYSNSSRKEKYNRIMNNTECCSETKTLQHFCFYTAKAVQFRYKSKRTLPKKH